MEERKRLSAKKKLLFSVAVFVVCAALIEFAVSLAYVGRDLFFPKPNESPGVCNRLLPLRYELTPNGTVPFLGMTAHINGSGLRGAEPEPEKKKIRVLCLGDSTTFGMGGDNDDASTYPALLQAMLDEKNPGKYEVLNAGMPGYCTLECVEFYIYRGVELKPDVIVFMCGWNDAERIQKKKREQTEFRSPLEALSTFRLCRAIGNRVFRKTDASSQASRLGALKTNDDLSETGFRRSRNALSAMARLSKAYGSRTILVTLPNYAKDHWTDAAALTPAEAQRLASYLHPFWLSAGGWKTFIGRTNGNIASVAAEERLALVDGAALNDMADFEDLCHLLKTGNRKLAERVAQAVMAP